MKAFEFFRECDPMFHQQKIRHAQVDYNFSREQEVNMLKETR
jgi:hypothetical protein